MIALCILAALLAAFLLILYASFLFTFRRYGKPPETFKGDSFLPFTREFEAGRDYYNALSLEDVSIRSRDGLTLHAKYAPTGDEKR